MYLVHMNAIMRKITASKWSSHAAALFLQLTYNEINWRGQNAKKIQWNSKKFLYRIEIPLRDTPKNSVYVLHGVSKITS